MKVKHKTGLALRAQRAAAPPRGKAFLSALLPAALLALGLTPEVAQTAIRFTLPEPITSELVAAIVDTFAAEVGSALGKRSGPI